jgi:predicted nucleic acid-binding protein
MKWSRKDGARAAARLLSKRYHLIAPDLIRAEFGNIMWKVSRRGALSGDEVAQIVEAFQAMPVESHDSGPLLSTATEIALQADITVYDALYIALALENDTACITAGRRLVRSVAGATLGERARLLQG